MDIRELASWLLLVFESRLPLRIVNGVLGVWCKQLGRTLRAFFEVDAHEWSTVCQLDVKGVERLMEVRGKLGGQMAVAERVQCEGIQVLTVLDDAYPKLVKASLSRTHIPSMLFAQGDLSMLSRQTIAIIGSRNANETSSDFARQSAQYLAKHGANIISGNARGVDRAAFEGANVEHGHTTLVLPHGIRKLSKSQSEGIQQRIAAGQVLLISQFHPEASWLVNRAMERNHIVTGLAQIVMVAESDEKGGTWEGANNALKQGRRVYVRTPSVHGEGETLPGNKLLLEQGAQPLSWPVDDISTLLTPVLQESGEVRQRHDEVEIPPDQLSLLASAKE